MNISAPAGIGSCISSTLVIFTRPTCQLSIVVLPSVAGPETSAFHAIGAAVTPDSTGGRRGEMRADHQDRRVGDLVQHAVSGDDRSLAVAIEPRRPLRVRDLDRVMHDVAGDHGALALGLD